MRRWFGCILIAIPFALVIVHGAKTLGWTLVIVGLLKFFGMVACFAIGIYLILFSNDK